VSAPSFLVCALLSPLTTCVHAHSLEGTLCSSAILKLWAAARYRAAEVSLTGRGETPKIVFYTYNRPTWIW